MIFRFSNNKQTKLTNKKNLNQKRKQTNKQNAPCSDKTSHLGCTHTTPLHATTLLSHLPPAHTWAPAHHSHLYFGSKLPTQFGSQVQGDRHHNRKTNETTQVAKP